MTAIAGANIRLGGDETGLISSLTNARKQFSLFTREINSSVAQAYKKADAEQKIFRGGLTRLGNEITSLGQKMALVGTLPTLFAAGKAYKDYADIQRMEKGLALYGSTLEDIRRLAKEPNIGVFDGAKSLVGLRAAKIEAGLAERAVKSFANAIAAAGGNAADLEPALLNLKQFKATRNINQVDLRQLSARIPQSSDVILKAFGTLDTEKLNKIGIDKFIEGFVTELEKIPKVAGGAGVAMEQVSDSFTFFSATIGEGLEKAFNVSDKISAIGGILDSLATNFKALNPEAQKAILWIGGLAVAIPALVTSIGGVIKLSSFIATGLGFATVPWAGIILGVMGVVSAIAAIIAIAPLAASNVAELNKQQEEVAGFSKKLNPLLSQYEALKEKTDLTAAEQKKLKDITKQIADLVPTAVKTWDNYGNAIDINTNKAASYTAEQRKLLAAMQATRREAILLDLQTSSRRKGELQSVLTSGKQTSRVNLGMGVYQDQTHVLLPAEVKKAATELADIQQKDAQNRAELLKIGGIDAYKKDLIELDSLTKKEIRLRKELSEALKGNDFNKSEDLRIEKSSVSEQIKAAKDRIRVAAPFLAQAQADSRMPKSPKVKETVIPNPKDDKPYKDTDNHTAYLKLLREEKKELKDIRDIAADIKKQDQSGSTLGDSTASGLEKAKKQLDNLGGRRMGSSLDDIGRTNAARPENIQLGAALDLKSYFKGRFNIDELKSYFAQIPKVVEESVEDYQNKINGFADATAKLGSYFQGNLSLDEMRKYFQAIPKIAEQSNADYQVEVEKTVDATIQLNQELTSALRSAATDIGVSFGEMLGNLASGAGGFEDFGKRLMGTIGGLLKDMGKALIAFGTSGIILKNLGKNPYLAVAAGIAMVALGQVAQKTVSKQAGEASVRLAKGGLAYGETRAIVGDNPNAKFDPEVVAPLSKLKSILNEDRKSSESSGGAWSHTVRIQGSDILLSLQRETSKNKALGIV